MKLGSLVFKGLGQKSGLTGLVPAAQLHLSSKVEAPRYKRFSIILNWQRCKQRGALRNTNSVYLNHALNIFQFGFKIYFCLDIFQISNF